jgi:hypothetical protein
MRIRITASLLLVLGAVLALKATTLQRYDLQELSERAEQVFVGTCVATGTELIEGRIYTRVEFEVQDMVKGRHEERVIVHFLGGEHEGTRLQLAGMPTFVDGEDVVLFLTEKDALDHPWPVGLAQGKFRVEYSGAAKKATVSRNLAGARYYPAAAAAKSAVAAPLNGLPLEEFLGRVRGYIEEGEHRDSR